MKSRYLLFIITFLSTLSLFGQTSAGGGWQDLFNGKDLKGWKRLGGKAEYTIEDGIIVGRTVMNSRNTFFSYRKRVW